MSTRQGRLGVLFIMFLLLISSSVNQRNIFAEEEAPGITKGELSFSQINEWLEEAGDKYGIPPVILKAIAWQESNWRHYDNSGKIIQSSQGYYGIMQVPNPNLGPRENIFEGARILGEKKWNLSMQGCDNYPNYIKEYDVRKDILENWFYAIVMYGHLKESDRFAYVKTIYSIIENPENYHDYISGKDKSVSKEILQYFYPRVKITAPFGMKIKDVDGVEKTFPNTYDPKHIFGFTLKDLVNNGGIIHDKDGNKVELSVMMQNLSWEILPPMLISRGWAGAVVEGGKIYVIGGCSSSKPQQFRNASNVLEVYDPKTNTWEKLASMSMSRVGPAVASLNGKIYVFGGFNEYTWSANDTMEIYDISTNTWSFGPSMPTPRSWMKAVVLNNKIYVIGGVGYGYRRDVEIFDPATNTWEIGTPILPRERYLHAVISYNNKIYVIGGDSWENCYDEFWDDIQEYDPITNVWTKKKPMPAPANGLNAIAIDGKIYVFGGIPKKNTIWVYDINSDEWTEITSNNNVPVDGSEAIVYLDGYIYRIGGGGWGPTLNVFERTNISLTLEEPDWFFNAINDFISKNRNGKLERFLNENKGHFIERVWDELKRELSSKTSFACIETKRRFEDGTERVIKAVEQCKALVNFYVKYILGKGQYLSGDKYVIDNGLSLSDGQKLETITKLGRKSYSKEELINAGVKRGDIFFIYVNPSERWGHYGIIYDVLDDDIKVLDANRKFDGILRISSIDELINTIPRTYNWEWIEVVRP
jgi:N-acetylneuraminic acid mutarotase